MGVAAILDGVAPFNGEECQFRINQAGGVDEFHRQGVGVATERPTSSTWAVARVVPSWTRMVQPSPGVDATSMLPFSRSTLVRSTSMPTPRPEISVTMVRVEKAGAQESAPEFAPASGLPVSSGR